MLQAMLLTNGCDAESFDGLENYGKMVQSTVALINHSCTPNVLLVAPNGYNVTDSVHIIALEAIKPGDELTMAYGFSHLPYHIRRHNISERWYFNCRCPLCLKSIDTQCTCSSCFRNHAFQGNPQAFIDPREAHFCGRLDCNGWLPKCRVTGKPVGSCSRCKGGITYNAEEVFAILEDGERLLKDSELMDYCECPCRC